jgi:hypothetical protein
MVSGKAVSEARHAFRDIRGSRWCHRRMSDA